MTSFRPIIFAVVAAASLGGCALFSSNSGLTTDEKLALVQTTVTALKAGAQTVCANAAAPAVCHDPNFQAKVDAAYGAVEDALGAARAAAAAGDDQAKIAAAIDAVNKGLADYAALTAAFK